MDYNQIFSGVQNGNDVRGAVIATAEEKVTLTPDLAQFIARAFAAWLGEKNGKTVSALRIGVGHDSRVSAAAMKAGCLKGLSFAQAFDCGLITTPAMFQSTVLPDSDFDGAVMLTASHLPFNRNGMKFFTKDGAIDKKDLKSILEKAADLAAESGAADAERIVAADSLPEGPVPAASFDMKSVYCGHMKKIICDAVGAEDYAHPLKGLHIVEDAGNGASGFFATEILAPLGADISGSVYLEPDGTFPNHVPNPENKTAMNAARQATLDAMADLGVIFDCDGDRGAVVFSDGTEVNRNVLIALLSVIVSEEHPGSVVVTDSVTSDELAEFLAAHGLKHLRFKRGYKNVIDRGIQVNNEGDDCELAIETSGHGAFKENHFSDDGAYIAVKIICRMAQLLKEGRKIESLIADLKSPAESVEIRFTIHAEDFKTYGGEVLDAYAKFAAEDPRFRVVEPNYEGIRVAFDDSEVKGWMLIRRSLHDPVLPMNIEAQAAGGVEIIKKRLAPFFARYDQLEAK